MLNNLRNKFDPIFEKLGLGFANLGFGPSFWTWIGLLLSIISAIMFSLHSPAIGVDWYTATILGGIFLLIAGFFDAIDGAVARVTNRTTPLGGYLDSVIDKVSEIIVFVGIMIGSFTNPVLVLVALSLSLLVSYTRAKGDGLGVDLKGKGIAERAERILIIAILGFIPFQDNMSVALWIIAVLSAITVLERLKVVSARLGTPLFSLQTFKDMFQRTHDVDRLSSSGTMTSRLNEPPTSLSKLTKNVSDYLDKSGNKKLEPSAKPTTSTTTSTTTAPPPKPSTTTAPPPKSETQTSQPKAQYLDKTDPNETGRNVAQIVFGTEEEEDERYKKFLESSQKQKSDTNQKSNEDSQQKPSENSKKSPDKLDNSSNKESENKQ
ncbi:CDP-alcohol phosphatidyltransferase family protein [Candidatus Nitrosocosmicus agrestis]|uniref:CDP-alcohol phosphatidyltransferase family protein n=1 Tax=Candidatus Nitrosocosmicus agrestis TaxID=2563600 RepID=UPI00122E248D|nr:CDP-alcohol phosphatidyltransferase family protein [Candidatus Nitrosocosmicus sp. SS]KAA2279155.1 CDP-alcohol phosphatidyltransferase family protein [Candidatus Nitrosocosmicus sp. SS]KAF0867661.1 CDP-alcohol phosphatidyltransferase family protein [Candidatus Nitrosocosmicus sp. SS]